MSTSPHPNESSSHGDSPNALSQRTWGAFIYRNWKWLAGLMVLGLIIDVFDGEETERPQPKAESSYSHESLDRKLPKVHRAAWGPTTLNYKGRYKLLDEPEKCKGKEYRMEVKYMGGGTRRDGKLEDCECTVFTDGNSFSMEFSFPSELKQPNIQVGDYLFLSFVFSGATKSFFSEPNVVTAVERSTK